MDIRYQTMTPVQLLEQWKDNTFQASYHYKAAAEIRCGRSGGLGKLAYHVAMARANFYDASRNPISQIFNTYK